MAYAEMQNTQIGFGLGARWRARLERNRRFRTTLKELDALSDRELADLGLSRSMLRGLAWESSEQA